MDRSGAVAQGLSAINTYMGENDPSDYVRYVRQDLMGITREDLVYDVGRHVDDSVHNFEKWGLPIWKQPGDEGKRLGRRRQAGPLGALADHDQRRVLQVDRRRGRKEGAWSGEYPRARASSSVWSPTRTTPPCGRCRGLLACVTTRSRLQIQGLPDGRRRRGQRLPTPFGGRGHRPRLVPGVERGLAPTPWPRSAAPSSRMMENRFVPARFKDGYGPVGAWFLLFKAKAMNAAGEDYQTNNAHMLEEHNYGTYVKGTPWAPACATI